MIQIRKLFNKLYQNISVFFNLIIDKNQNSRFEFANEKVPDKDSS